MSRIWTAALAAIVLLHFAPVHAQDQPSPLDCDSLQPERMIAGCTALIGLRGIPDKFKALALLRRGMGHFALGNVQGAVADLEASRALNAQDITVHNELGLAYDAQGDHRRAIGAYGDGLRITPDHSDLHYNRGISYMRLGDVDKALADFSEAVKHGPTDATAFIDGGEIERAAYARVQGNYYKALASAYSAKGDYDRAFATHNEAVKQFPQFAYVYVNRAETFDAKGDLAGALADLDRAAKLEPNSSSMLGARAFIRFKAGDFTGAGADFEKAWSINPREVGPPMNYVPIWLYLTLARSGSTTSAAAALTRLLPQVDHAHWPFPVIKLLLGQASPEVTLAAAKTPDETCEAQFYVGAWRQLQGDKSGARAGYEIARNTCPKTFMEFRGAEAELKRPDPQ